MKIGMLLVSNNFQSSKFLRNRKNLTNKATLRSLEILLSMFSKLLMHLKFKP